MTPDIRSITIRQSRELMETPGRWRIVADRLGWNLLKMTPWELENLRLDLIHRARELAEMPMNTQ